MLLSCNRLKKYIKNSDTIDWLDIWNKFTIRTAEVEDVHEVGKNIDGIVIAEIKECVEHPNSNHLHILKVDTGKDTLTQVVCGAPNVRVGLKTAFVQVGGHIDNIEITARPLRGVESFGMCCSGKELGISDNHDGIIELPTDAPVGMNIKEYLPIEDIIVEIDNKSLTNRPDLWGHYGIAREICAISKNELLPLDIESVTNDKKDLNINIKANDLCYRYTALTVDNIKNNKTPFDMQIFLYYVGMRSISLLVDLTNYIMLELGQPMHAFDARVVKEIEVDTAKDNDEFTTLDGVKRILHKDNLMIKNGNEYFGIAGVMGGYDSEIKDDTTSLFLESANFNAGSIRRTAVQLGIRTEASARYEKSLDPNMTSFAIERLLYLLRKVNKDLIVTSNLTDIYPNKLEKVTINLKKDLVTTYMGEELSDEVVTDILESLEFKVTIKEDSYDVLVPTFRHSKDINIAEDLIEEIARIYGLENITPRPLKLELNSKELENTFNEEYETKKLLAEKYDMHEVHSYLWYDTSMLKELNITKDGVKLLGKTDNNILRDDLSFSLLNIVRENFKNYNSFKLFEIGTIIKNNANKRILSIIIADSNKELEQNYNLTKSIVKYLFKILKGKNVDIIKNNKTEIYYNQDLSKLITIDDSSYGTINVLNTDITNKLSKKKQVICIDIDFDKFIELNKETIIASNISKYPTVELDYTIIAPSDIKYSYIKETLEKYKNDFIQNYKLIGTYENKYTIKYTIGSNTKTLEQKELQGFKDSLIQFLKDNNLSIIE